MALNDISFIKGQGGLGRPLPGEDFISGLVLYGTAPSGFAANNIQKIFSLAGAEALGIKNDYSDETPATATISISAVGNDGDILSIVVNEPLPNSNIKPVTLGTYTKTSTETTLEEIAVKVSAAINAGTIAHGYSVAAGSSNANGAVTVTVRKGLGIALNSGTPLTGVSTPASPGATGTIAASPSVNFTGGTLTPKVCWHYQIAEYFRMQPQGVLYVGIFPVPGTYTYTEIQAMQQFAGGVMRQLAVHCASPATPQQLTDATTTIQSVVNLLEAEHMPLSVLFSANIKAISDLSTLKDLSANQANKVSVVIAQDGGNQGAMLFLTQGKSIPTLGAALGAVSLAAVSQSIAWVQNFNISDGLENSTIAFANGQLYSSTASPLLSTLNSYRYLFLRSFIGLSGSYFNDSHCACSYTSDYAYIENNRTIDKAIRVVYAGVLPYLNGPITLNADGTIADISIAYVEDQLVNPQLDQMVRDGDLSAYGVTIDPTQNVLSTSKLIIALRLVSKGVARNIVINIGYTQSL